MDDLLDILELLGGEIRKNVKNISKCKDLNQKKLQAEIVKLLCESMGVFLTQLNAAAREFMDDVDDFDEFDDETGEDDDFDDDDFKRDIPF